MKARGLAVKVLFPIVAFMVVLAAFGALRTRGIIGEVMDDYHCMIITQERDEILNILRTGPGLSLYIVHSIVANHRGYVNLRSEPGSGPRFSAFFPACPEAGEAGEEAEGEEAAEGEGNVLVIDDEPDVRELRRTARAAGVRRCSRIGRQGRDRDLQGKKWGYRRRPPRHDHAADERHRGLSGPQGIDPAVRVVLVSGYTTDGFSSIDRLLKAGAKVFVQKPFTQKALAKAIQGAMKA